MPEPAAPLIVKDMVITGIAGGEYGIRGFLDAYDAKTGKRRWRFGPYRARVKKATTRGPAIRGRLAAAPPG